MAWSIERMRNYLVASSVYLKRRSIDQLYRRYYP